MSLRGNLRSPNASARFPIATWRIPRYPRRRAYGRVTPFGPVAPIDYIDAGTVLLKLTPSGTEEKQQYDAATVTFILTPSGTEEKQQYDIGTVPLALIPSGTELTAKEYTDTGTVTFTLVPSGTEEKQQYDAATVTFILTPSGTDIQEASFVYAILYSRGNPWR